MGLICSTTIGGGAGGGEMTTVRVSWSNSILFTIKELCSNGGKMLC